MLIRLHLPSWVLATLISVACPAAAQDRASSLAGKTITIYIGFGPGGGYDL